MTLNFTDIEQVECSSLPKILSMFWDIETLNHEGPGIFPIGEKESDEVYMTKQISVRCLKKNR